MTDGSRGIGSLTYQETLSFYKAQGFLLLAEQ